MKATLVRFINWIGIGEWDHDDWIAAGTLVIAVFTAVLGTGTLVLVRDGRRHSERQLRAFVFPKASSGKHNNGPTQGRKFSSHVSWEPWVHFEGDLPPDFAFEDKGKPGRPRYIAPNGDVFGHHLPIQSCILSAVQGGNLRLFIWGWATYWDIFEGTKIHTTRFCFELDRIDGDPYRVPTEPGELPTIFFNFRTCERYNCADEDCAEEGA